MSALEEVHRWTQEQMPSCSLGQADQMMGWTRQELMRQTACVLIDGGGGGGGTGDDPEAPKVPEASDGPAGGRGGGG
ncbi:hypothetical protein Tco_0753155 [Tanacetum coccineum]